MSIGEVNKNNLTGKDNSSLAKISSAQLLTNRIEIILYKCGEDISNCCNIQGNCNKLSLQFCHFPVHVV